MNTPHLSEQQIQDYAEHPSAEPQLVAHVHACAGCQHRVAAYRQLFAVLAAAPPPAEAINLAAQILGQLPAPPPRFPRERALAGLLLLGFAAGVLAVGWPALRPALLGTSTGTVALLLVLTASVVLGYGLELGARYRRQRRILAG